MFLFKKMVAPLLLPLPLCFLVLAAGLALLWFTRRQKTGKAITTVGFAALLVLSYGWVSDPMLRSLERIHLPLAGTELAGVKWVVVLGAGTSSDPSLPISHRLTDTSLERLIEGIRLHRQVPGSRLLLSGASVFASGSDAEAMSAMARALGVAPASLVLDDESRDTESQAENIARIVKDERCVVVTSAHHMQRALGLFKKAGIAPVPAPTDYIVQSNAGLSPADFYPGIGGLVTSQIVEYEYLGTLWARLRGRI